MRTKTKTRNFILAYLHILRYVVWQDLMHRTRHSVWSLWRWVYSGKLLDLPVLEYRAQVRAKHAKMVGDDDWEERLAGLDCNLQSCADSLRMRVTKPGETLFSVGFPMSGLLQPWVSRFRALRYAYMVLRSRRAWELHNQEVLKDYQSQLQPKAA